MSQIKIQINWVSERVSIAERPFLICFNKKCMSGKISNLERKEQNLYEAEIVFIEIEYFLDEIFPGNKFTINEASTILANGTLL